jgi:hypothetical protein
MFLILLKNGERPAVLEPELSRRVRNISIIRIIAVRAVTAISF